MPLYKAPLRDMQFVLKDLLKAEDHYASLQGREEVTPDLMDAILTEGAKFAEEVLAPLNQTGDQQGCTWSEDGVTTPEGFKEAYDQYREAGWTSISARTEFGGQGLPPSMGLLLSDMVGGANWSWSMYPGLSGSAARVLEVYGNEMQQERYLPKMTEGSWMGTMCLTEPHAGSDVGLSRTKASNNGDGTYNITGTKIFISSGDHDMTENIIHLVLARVEGAPEGTKGISLFLVPKFIAHEDGSLGDRNGVTCGSIEHKMGIKGSATAVLNFDAATGYLIGEENQGLGYMFLMMNTARMGTAMQGLSLGQLAYQGGLEYARERLQMRSLSGPKNPDGPADPIIVHPDVRRMLLTQKALTEGSRAFLYWILMLVDQASHGESEEIQKEADELLHLLTPIAKAFVTETGLEVANYGMQIYGGHGYIGEWGMEQIVRDLRISTLYEGTTGIQALDLLGRKIMGTGGKALMGLTKRIHKFCEAQAGNAAMEEFVVPLAQLNKEWGEITMQIGEKAMQNPDEVGAASVDYLMYSGYIAIAFMWAQMVELAAGGSEGDAFMASKVKTARFYFQRLLPRTESHKLSMLSGADNLMALDVDEFAF